MIKRFYLTGYMTSGKSTIGPILANVLGWDFYDLDQVIEIELSKSVVEIFEDEGEDFFRDYENKTLIKLSGLDNVIISLGGGTISNRNNFDVIKKNGKLIYLKVSPDVIYKRIKNKIDRPLFRDLVLAENSENAFLDKINNHMQDRLRYYEKADITIDTDATRIGVTVDILAKQIKRMINADS
ncbi:MAG: shikimate kinase [Ignavibacteriae bacterium]|nr:shikimate kinase [Ignavibacteriota bacterium]NOG97787.1 shikimate kinase [Ignavibacteriota bacterium]